MWRNNNRVHCVILIIGQKFGYKKAGGSNTSKTQ